MQNKQLWVKKATSESSLIACRRFLSKDLAANVLALGDLYQPLLNVSDIYCAIKNGRTVGVCSIYHGYPTPSLVLGTTTLNIKQILIRKALNTIQNSFISLCQPPDVAIFKEYATILQIRQEQQMITTTPKHVKSSDKYKATKLRKKELESLNEFYSTHHTEAWTPLQFKAGPFYCVKHGNKIVSAAGVHIVTPKIAQLGNIVTDETWRNRGLATLCTSALAGKLAAKGRIISLFVRKNNAPAIHIYKNLGFSKIRDIAFLLMQKKLSKNELPPNSE